MKISLKQKLVKREQAKFYNNLDQVSAIYTPYQLGLNAQIGNDWALECYKEEEVEAELENGIGILEIEGYIGSDGWFGGVEADDVEKSLNNLKNAGISQIVLKINSGGGCVNAEAEINEVFRKFIEENLNIALTSFIDETGASAAYSIACNAKKIYSNSIPSFVQIGSIGSKTKRFDVSGNNIKEKIEVNIIASGEKKAWGDPSLPMGEAEKAYLENRIAETSTIFFNRVSQARNIPVETIKSWEAGVFNNNEALANGLIDGVLRFDELIDILKNDMLNIANPPFILNDMSKELIDENVELKIKLKSLETEVQQLKSQVSTNPLQEENQVLKNTLNKVLENKKQEAICAYQAFSGEQLDDNNPVVATIKSLSSLEEVEMTAKKYQTLLKSVGTKPVQAVAELPNETTVAEQQNKAIDATNNLLKQNLGLGGTK